MATAGANRILDHLRHALRGHGGESADSTLLAQYINDKDHSAFAALVRRHGPMVLGVCRRILRHEADAEDAFQATFVVLARKASSLARREQLSSWLCGVAYRVALEARSINARRRRRERQLDSLPDRPIVENDSRVDLLALLDQEVQRLPDKYRLPVILCELQGLTRRETARRLDLPEGTLSSRLATARRMLASRLGRNGTHVSLAAVFAWAKAPPISIPLLTTTVRAASGAVSASAAVLVTGVLRIMLFTKIRFILASVFVLATLGTVTFTYRGEAAQTADAVRVAPARDEIDALRLEIEALRKSLNATRDRVRVLEDRAGIKEGNSLTLSLTDNTKKPEPQNSAKQPNDPKLIQSILDSLKRAQSEADTKTGKIDFQRVEESLRALQDANAQRDIGAQLREEKAVKEEAMRRLDAIARLYDRNIKEAEAQRRARDNAIDTLLKVIKQLEDNPKDTDAVKRLQAIINKLGADEKADPKQKSDNPAGR